MNQTDKSRDIIAALLAGSQPGGMLPFPGMIPNANPVPPFASVLANAAQGGRGGSPRSGRPDRPLNFFLQLASQKGDR